MLSKIRELRGERAQILNDQRSMLEAATDDGLNTEDRSKYDKLTERFEKLSDAIKIAEDYEKRAAALESDPKPSPAAPDPASDPTPDDPEKRARARGMVGIGEFYDKRKRYVRSDSKLATPEYREAFNLFLAGKPQVGEVRALQADVDASGGYTYADEQFNAMLIQAKDDAVFLRRSGTVIPVRNADSLGTPTLAANPADSEWQTELSSGTADTAMAFGKRSLTPELSVKRILVSQKLLRTSALNIDALVRDRFAYKFGITEEKAFISGTGTGQPLGLFTISASGITAGRNQIVGTTSAITGDGLLDAQGALRSPYQPNARWLFHRTSMTMIRKLKGAATGNDHYLFQPGLVPGAPDTLLGKPIDVSEYVPNTYTTGLPVGMYGDFSNYWIADALNFTVQRLDELYAETNHVGFIGRAYTDGAPVLEDAFVRMILG